MNFKIFRKKGPILVKRSTIKKEGKAQVTFKNDEFWGYSLINGQFKWSEGAITLSFFYKNTLIRTSRLKLAKS